MPLQKKINTCFYIAACLAPIRACSVNNKRDECRSTPKPNDKDGSEDNKTLRQH